MADYSFPLLPSVLMKRVRYFNGQFLKDDDFVEDQKYHIDRRRRHERLLHVAGISDGLVVTAAGDGKSVTVSPGAAIDDQGRQILLEKPTVVSIPAGAAGTMLLELSFRETESDPSDPKSTVKGNTRFLQDPLLAITAKRTGSNLLLAELPINASSATTGTPITTNRVYSGVRLPTVPGSPELSLRARSDGRGAALSGGLSVAGLLEAQSAVIAGDLGARTLSSPGAGVLTINAECSLSAGLAVARGLNVTGDGSFGGALFTSRNLSVGADASISGALSVSRGMSLAGDAGIGGGLTVGRGLTTNGPLTANAGITSNGPVSWAEAGSRTEPRDNAGLRGDAGAKSGFFQTPNPVNFPPGATSWWYLLDVRHSNPSNNHAMQFAGSFSDQKLWFRKTIDNPSMPWQQVALADASGLIRENGALLQDKYAPRDRVISGGRGFFAVLQDDSNFVVAQSNGTPLWSWLGGRVSDGRLKRQVEPVTDALRKLARLRGVSFYWNDEALGTARELGVIAQEVEAVLPEVVTTMNDHKLVSYEKLVPVLIQAIKEQTQRIEQLEHRLQALGGLA